MHKNSFYLYDTDNALRGRYRYDFVSDGTLVDIGYLIKMGIAKHEFGGDKPTKSKINRILQKHLPKREFDGD